MKKTIFFLLMLCISIFADTNSSAEVELLVYKTSDKTLGLDEIRNKKDIFSQIKTDEKFNDMKSVYWIKLQTNGLLEKGEYFISYVHIDFDISSFTKEQRVYKFLSGRTKILRFFYDKDRDKDSYYFRFVPREGVDTNYHFMIQPADEFYEITTEYFYYLRITGILLGLILMTALYNVAVYYYKRENEFLYYALMQVFMVAGLVYVTGLIDYITKNDILQYDMFNLISLFFATLFVRSFFDTYKYLIKWDKALIILLTFTVFDIFYLFFTDTSIINTYKLYSVFGLSYIFIGFIRYRDGFKPAKFFLIGWIVLLISVFFTEYYEEYFEIDFLLIGSTIEAIFLAIGLAYNIRLIDEEKEQQKELLVHQSKLAAMGEMIGNIAHQWRQPLTYLSYNFMTLKELANQDLLDKKYLDKKLDDATTQLEFMSQTIDDFKDFYSPHKNKELFSLEEATKQALELMQNSLQENSIEVVLNIQEDIEVENYKNEYKQVLLNLLSNAKDAFLKQEIKLFKIIITINKNIITVSDNAGGIDAEVIARIFDPYFSTKEGSTGIGLYMSKIIVEKNMKGVLKVENSSKGSVFTLLL